MNIIDYIREEVDRQGHDITKLDGLTRVGGMIQAWCYAMNTQPNKSLPTTMDLIQIARLIEPKANAQGLRTCRVSVGVNNNFPDPDEVPIRLQRLWSVIGDMPALDFYREALRIHPFSDGNGRSFKVILNWISGSLHSPFFPPNNIFGHPIRNP